MNVLDLLRYNMLIPKIKYHNNLLFNIGTKRYKSKVHWAKLRRKTGPTHKALDHFDQFYGSVFNYKWEPMKKALMRKQKYVALVNNFGDTEETMKFLESKGAHNMRKLIEVERSYLKTYNEPSIFMGKENTYTSAKEVKEPKLSADDILEKYQKSVQDLDKATIYPEGAELPEVMDTGRTRIGAVQSSEADPISETIQTESDEVESNMRVHASNASMETMMRESVIDETRVIQPDTLTSAALQQYVPASKLRGLEEWVPESQHYQYYSSAKDFPLTVEPDEDVMFPEQLKVYTYEDENINTFPTPKRSVIGTVNYYPMNGSSILPVIALGLQGGERVLDLCSAPGGKALVMLQTLLPDVLVCNDVSRPHRIAGVLKDYLCDFETSNKWREQIIIKKVDGRFYKDEQPFDRVLVDAPCTTDRHSVMKPENNMFRQDRVKERLRLPETQSHLLCNALSLARVGGTVVYSTCSLSPIQNDGVVHMALKLAFEKHGVTATIKDMKAWMQPYRVMFRLCGGNVAPRYGQLVVPHVSANFGPMYFSKIVRSG